MEKIASETHFEDWVSFQQLLGEENYEWVEKYDVYSAHVQSQCKKVAIMPASLQKDQCHSKCDPWINAGWKTFVTSL